MSKITDYVLLPPSRLVAGSLYKANTKDANGRPKLNKDGQPKIEYWFAVAIPKGNENHWSETSWGRSIWEFGYRVFPDAAKRLTFAWKIKDGDSQEPNTNGKRPCDQEGHPGNWIVGLSSKFAPNITGDAGRKVLSEPDFVNCGDYVEVYINLKSNDSPQTPGIHLNHVHINFLDRGERIESRPDPESVGFTGALPANAQVVRFNPAASPTPATTGSAYSAPGTPAPMPPGVTPHREILQTSGIAPPPPAAPAPRGPRMTALAGNYTYDQYIAQGWKDADLISNGLMEA
jgi:hypothetical protein